MEAERLWHGHPEPPKIGMERIEQIIPFFSGIMWRKQAKLVMPPMKEGAPIANLSRAAKTTGTASRGCQAPTGAGPTGGKGGCENDIAKQTALT